MLKLEKVELRGFKSFCDYTAIELEETITAIVGPNGCGKSNIVDSITWVLGEQSARLLRGARMEDVIFQGSRSRQPQGFAEVTLHLMANKGFSNSNGDQTAAADAVPEAEGATDPQAKKRFRFTAAAGDIIMVGRRLYRSGESEYRLNGRRVRLRDVHDIFAGTGLGPGHYAIIGQGNVEEVLTAKPFERRGVIEAAAGITKFRLRQRSIDLRLQSARQNLVRVSDLIVELERQVRSLKRQAAKARRFRRFREEWRGLLRILLVAEQQRLERELETLSQQISQATLAHSQLISEVGDLEREYRQVMDEMRRWESGLTQSRERQSSIDLQLERTRGQRSSCQEQITNQEMNLEALRREADHLNQRSELMQDEVRRSAQQLEQLSTTVQSDYQALDEQESVYQAEVANVKQAEEAIEQMRQQMLEETNNNADLRSAVQQIDVDIERIEQQLSGLRAERERAQAKQEELEAGRAEVSEQVARDRQQLQDVEQEISHLEDRLQETRQAKTEQTEKITALERERLAVDERLGLLLELDRQHAYCSPAVQRLLQQGARQRGIHLLGTLADVLRLRPEHERMVESVLGPRLQALLTPSIKQATMAISFLEQTNSGEATFLVIGDRSNGQSEAISPPDDGPARKGREPGEHHEGSFVDLLGLEPDVRQSLCQAFPEIAEASVVADLKAAIASSSRQRTKLFVTPEGGRVRAGRLLAGGGKEEDMKSLLAVKREIQQLGDLQSKLSQAVGKASQTLANTERRLEALERDLAEFHARRDREQKGLLEREMQLTNLENDLTRSDQHLRVVQFEVQQAEQDRQDLLSRRDRLADVRQQAEQQLAQVKSKNEQAQVRLQEIRKEVGRLAETLSSLRARMAATLERKRSLEADLRRFQAGGDEIRQQLQTNALETEQVAEELKRLRASLRETELTLKQLHADRAAVETEVRQASDRVEHLRKEVDQLNAKLNERRTGEREVRERLAQLEVEQAEFTSDARHLAERCRSELVQSLDEVMALVRREDYWVDTQVDVKDLGAIKNRVQELRHKIDEMGPVNMMALDELDVQQERFEFLQDQRQDVMESMTSTEKALEEIKRRSRRRFAEAFERINANFSEMFQELFGGGRGRMVLLDEANPLESGIDIIAQPPGKRLQNVMLLSGGEKSLAAFALLLAIFQFRPSPFCVLDEVDAALDDVNVKRFTKKIEDMSQHTQFIIVTHNKNTMQVAGNLHGVTMEEPGVSKLVSVRLK